MSLHGDFQLSPASRWLGRGEERILQRKKEKSMTSHTAGAKNLQTVAQHEKKRCFPTKLSLITTLTKEFCAVQKNWES